MQPSDSQSPAPTVSMGESALMKLTDAFDQYTAATVCSTSFPQFSGAPGEDVHEFLRKFKLATLTFKNDQLKCLALQKALVGSARIWAKSNIKQQVQAGLWAAAKRALVDRFSEPDREVRYRERLNKMHFNGTTETLTSYVENYSDCFRKAHPGALDADLMKCLSINLPPNIIRHLNTLSDEWNSNGDWPTFYLLIKRIENKILPFEPKLDTSEDKNGIEALTKLVSELKESLRARPDPPEAPTASETCNEAVAAFNFGPRNQNTFRGQNDQRFKKTYGPHRHQNNSRGRQAPYEPRRQESQTDSGKPHMSEKELQAAYFKKFGDPPSPCHYCGGNHYNRHCMFRELKD